MYCTLVSIQENECESPKVQGKFKEMGSIIMKTHVVSVHLIIDYKLVINHLEV